MQELSMLPDPHHPQPELAELLERMEADLKQLRSTVDRLGKQTNPTSKNER